MVSESIATEGAFAKIPSGKSPLWRWWAKAIKISSGRAAVNALAVAPPT
jgi:hypothetical protein